MNFNKIKTFQIIAETLSFTSAAKKLRISQPAVSQQLQQLEEELGMILVKRKRGKISLTPEGARLLPIFKRAFGSIEEAIRFEQAQLERLSGHIKIGSLMDHATPFDLSKKLIAFSQQYPEVDIEVLYGSNTQIEQWLREGRIDFGFSIVFSTKNELKTIALNSERHVLACSREQAENISQLPIEAIIDTYRLVDFTDDFLCLSPFLKKNFPEKKHLLSNIVPAVIVPNFREAVKFVSSGWGVSILPHFLVEENRSQLSQALANLEDLRVTLDLSYLASKNLSYIEKKLISSMTS